MSLHALLFIALVLFCIGLFMALERRNMIAILIGIELMLNGASLNFMAFNHFLSVDPVIGQVMVLFIIGLAAAEISIAFSIILSIYWSRRTIDVERMDNLKG